MSGDISETDADSEFPSGPRPGNRETTFFDDPVKDHLLRALVTVTMELSVTRDRLASLETLLVDEGSISIDTLNSHMPDLATAQAREAERSKLIQDVLGPLVKRLAQAD